MYKIDEHISCSVAGITADANIVLNYARLTTQRYLYRFQELMPVEDLVRTICDLKQGYTQFGGLRPFGVSLVIAGWDEHFGYQLYKSDPSGNYSGWKATAIGSGHQQANNTFKSDYKDDMDLESGLKLAVKVLAKTMDTTILDHEKLEFSTLTRVDNKVVYKLFNDQEIDQLISTVKIEKEED